MAKPGVTVEIEGLDHALESLLLLGEHAAETDDLWEVIAEELQAEQEEWLDTEGEGSWPDLAESTIEFKARSGFPADAMVQTGALVESLTGGGGNAVRKTEEDSLIFGTEVYYARFHQHGEGVPERPVLVPMDAARMKKVTDAVVAHIMEDVGR